MGCPTKVQVIKRKHNEQWYVNLPFAIAQAMGFEKGEEVEWHVEHKGLLALERKSAPPSLLKKKRQG
jgi:antitoxin component of MazEF toxin-antitoxin module